MPGLIQQNTEGTEAKPESPESDSSIDSPQSDLKNSEIPAGKPVENQKVFQDDRFCYIRYTRGDFSIIFSAVQLPVDTFVEYRRDFRGPGTTGNDTSQKTWGKSKFFVSNEETSSKMDLGVCKETGESTAPENKEVCLRNPQDPILTPDMSTQYKDKCVPPRIYTTSKVDPALSGTFGITGCAIASFHRRGRVLQIIQELTKLMRPEEISQTLHCIRVTCIFSLAAIGRLDFRAELRVDALVLDVNDRQGSQMMAKKLMAIAEQTAKPKRGQFKEKEEVDQEFDKQQEIFSKSLESKTRFADGRHHGLHSQDAVETSQDCVSKTTFDDEQECPKQKMLLQVAEGIGFTGLGDHFDRSTNRVKTYRFQLLATIRFGKCQSQPMLGWGRRNAISADLMVLSKMLREIEREPDRLPMFLISTNRTTNTFQTALTRSGIFFFGDMDRTRCVLRRGVLRDCNALDDAILRKHHPHPPNGHISLGTTCVRIWNSTVSSEVPFRFSVSPQEASQELGLETRESYWAMKGSLATSEDIAKSCSGSDDFHKWEYDDIPWIENTNRFPNCRFLTIDSNQPHYTAPKQDGSSLDSGSKPRAIRRPPDTAPRGQEPRKKTVKHGTRIRQMIDKGKDSMITDVPERNAFGQSLDRTNTTISEYFYECHETANVENGAPPPADDDDEDDPEADVPDETDPQASTHNLSATLPTNTPPPRVHPNVNVYFPYDVGLQTFRDNPYFLAHSNPSADRVARARFYCDGHEIVCHGCDSRHPFTIFGSNNLHTIDLHHVGCQFRHIRLCTRCTENLESIGIDDSEICRACHRVLNVKAFNGLQPTYANPPPNPSPRAFCDHQCVICFRKMDYAPHHDICKRCSRQICDVCVMEGQFHQC